MPRRWNKSKQTHQLHSLTVRILEALNARHNMPYQSAVATSQTAAAIDTPPPCRHTLLSSNSDFRYRRQFSDTDSSIRYGTENRNCCNLKWRMARGQEVSRPANPEPVGHKCVGFQSGSHRGGYEELCLLRCNAVCCSESWPKFQKNILAPSSGSQSKARNEQSSLCCLLHDSFLLRLLFDSEDRTL
jgi:hypothetical protein